MLRAALLFADIHDVIPDFDARARILSIEVTRDDWPPQRAVAGFDLQHATPLRNLWNSGDPVPLADARAAEMCDAGEDAAEAVDRSDRDHPDDDLGGQFPVRGLGSPR